MPREGRLVSFTVLNVASAEFQGEAPMAIGLIELENGVKVMAQVVDVPPSSLREGMKVTMVARPLTKADGAFLCYKFVPAG